jgi:hypothetical protein
MGLAVAAGCGVFSHRVLWSYLPDAAVVALTFAAWTACILKYRRDRRCAAPSR